MNKGVSSWFHNVSTYSEKIILNIFFIENSFKYIYIMEFGHTFGIVRKKSIHRI